MSTEPEPQPQPGPRVITPGLPAGVTVVTNGQATNLTELQNIATRFASTPMGRAVAGELVKTLLVLHIDTLRKVFPLQAGDMPAVLLDVMKDLLKRTTPTDEAK